MLCFGQTQKLPNRSELGETWRPFLPITNWTHSLQSTALKGPFFFFFFLVKYSFSEAGIAWFLIVKEMNMLLKERNKVTPSEQGLAYSKKCLKQSWHQTNRLFWKQKIKCLGGLFSFTVLLLAALWNFTDSVANTCSPHVSDRTKESSLPNTDLLCIKFLRIPILQLQSKNWKRWHPSKSKVRCSAQRVLQILTSKIWIQTYKRIFSVPETQTSYHLPSYYYVLSKPMVQLY